MEIKVNVRGISCHGSAPERGDNAIYKMADIIKDIETIGAMKDYDEDYTICDVIYTNGEDSLTVSYTYEEYEQLDLDSITAYGYETSDGTRLFFTNSDPSLQQITATYRNVQAEKMMPGSVS